jgi:hypothetical protein
MSPLATKNAHPPPGGRSTDEHGSAQGAEKGKTATSASEGYAGPQRPLHHPPGPQVTPQVLHRRQPRLRRQIPRHVGAERLRRRRSIILLSVRTRRQNAPAVSYVPGFPHPSASPLPHTPRTGTPPLLPPSSPPEAPQTASASGPAPGTGTPLALSAGSSSNRKSSPSGQSSGLSRCLKAPRSVYRHPPVYSARVF